MVLSLPSDRFITNLPIPPFTAGVCKYLLYRRMVSTLKTVKRNSFIKESEEKINFYFFTFYKYYNINFLENQKFLIGASHILRDAIRSG